MKTIITLASALFLFSGIATAQKNDAMDLDNLADSASYSIGVNIAQNLQQQGITEINVDALAKAMSDVYGGAELKISPAQAQQVIQQYMQDQKEAKYKVNKEAGEKFLAENAKKEGVVVLPSGLQYEIMVEGSGPKPGPTSKVTTHYHGTLVDGTVFDSSVDRGQPASFGVNQVIKGWTEALQLMPVGSKWRLFIPYDLAYGANPRPGVIKPYDALVFEVELISID